LTSIARAVRVNRPYHADAKNSPVEAAVSAAPNYGSRFYSVAALLFCYA